MAVSYEVLDEIELADELNQAWDFYRLTFEPINKLAATRHLLTRDEFRDVMLDETIEKHIAWDVTGRIVGMSTITNSLPSWPTISPQYFRHKHPEAYLMLDIWYVGFAGTAPNRSFVFRGLLEQMTRGRRDHGLFYMDFCQVNLDRGIVDLCTNRLADIDHRVKMRQVDAQTFWLTTFGADT